MRVALVCSTLLLAACRAHAPTWQPLSFELARGATADRLVLLSEREVHFTTESDGRACADESLHTAVRVARPGVLDRHIDVAYDRTFLRRPSIWARVVFPDGTENGVPERTYDVPAFDRDTLYRDQRLLVLPVPPVPPGAALEVLSRQRVVDIGPLVFSHAFGAGDPVGFTRLVVTLPEDWELEWRATRLGEPIPLEPTVTTADGRRRYVWEQSKIAAYTREPHGVDPRMDVPRVTVRLKSWFEGGEPRHAPASTKELSAWIFEKTRALSAPDDAMRATVQEVLGPAELAPREKARLLYQHAVENVRYCAIAIGYGGWFPHAAAEVEKKRYGDCKDKANYLKGLLDAAGVKSRTVALFAHSGFPAAVGMPSLVGNFNHQALLVELPEGPLFVDPTSRTVPFGEVPPQDREAWCMPIEEGGGELLQVPPSVPQEHGERQQLTLGLDAAGDARGDFTLETHGIAAALLRDRLVVATPARRASTVSEWLGPRDQLHVSDVTALSGLELGPTLTATGRLEAPRVMVRASGAGVVRLSSLAPRWLPVLPDTDRRTPVVLSMFHNTRTGAVRLTPVAGLELRRMPAPVSLESRWFDYRLAFKREGRALVAERHLVVKQRLVQPAEVEELKAALDQVQRAENAPALFEEVDK